MNINKFHILQCEIGFVSFHSKSGQLHPSTLKAKAGLIFPEPKNMKDAQSFVGLISYFRKFDEDYSLIAKLTDLLRFSEMYLYIIIQFYLFIL